MLAKTFAQKLNYKRPLITVEFSPPRGVDVTRLLNLSRQLVGKVDAINIPDCQRAMLKMSSMAAARLVQDETGLETVWQITCRDRNLIALQSDLLGAYALGLRNVLVLTGDPVQVGDQKSVAQQVFHLDSVRFLDLVQTMNMGFDASAQVLKHGATQFTLGSAVNPFRVFNHAQRNRLRQKMERGVQFFQTQPVYDVDSAKRLMEVVQDVADEVRCAVPKVLLGIIPPRNANAARMMNKSIVGVQIPNLLIDLLDRCDNPAEESLRYCAEVIEALKPFADGFHIMPVGMESKVGGLLDQVFYPPLHYSI
jgi:methylenetetrahydrofolate reductase (NADPH)